ncbi:cache domain-containing sensor histidine kinase [Paenibacillus mucilaginosus]|uniref:cache domain-containing sensor histidine kinase n=1 Tax=Paenibacillus mucilaginosus TaxID=61624 RepID=UPI003D1CE55B
MRETYGKETDVGRNSLRFKLIVVLLIATIAPIVTSMIVTNAYTKQSVKEKAIQENTNLLGQSRINIVNYMNQLIDLSFSVYKNPSFIRLMDLGFRGYQSEAEIKNLIRTIAVNREVFQVYMNILERNPGEDRSFLLTNNTVIRPSPEVTMPLNPLIKPGSYEAVVETTHTSHDYGLSLLAYFTPREVLTIHRAIYRVPSMEHIGSLSVDFSLDTLSGLLHQLLNDQEEAYLLDSEGRLIYSSVPGVKFGWKLQDPWVEQMLQASDTHGTMEDKSSIHLYEKIETPYMNWYLVKKVPYEQLYRGARELTQIQFLILGILLFVVAGLTLWISVRFTRPIKELIGYINIIQTGQLDVDIQVRTKDEIGILARRFRLMMDTINDLITREYKLGLANKTNQLKALQAQINPHFLYNSLQSIGTLALQHQAPKVYHLISTLAKMMRYSMNTSESLVPLRKEVEHAKAYLELQQQRFENELTVGYHIDEATVDCVLPKMTLQPLIENYFMHGFDPRENPGELIISSRLLADGSVELTVEDNGRGMSDEALQELSLRLAQSDPAADAADPGHLGESIGLKNVKNRLELHFNHTAVLFLEHREPTGLRITLRFPSTPLGGSTL